MKLSRITLLLLSNCISFAIWGQLDFSIPQDNPVELGKVNWLRNIDEAITKAEAEDKAIFLLFQEVPGCSTCTSYGDRVLSHPLIVETIENYFIPLAIFNNKGGQDKKVLQYFKEPSWNNPVVRIIDANKKNIIDRVAGNYSTLGIVNSIIDALTRVNVIIPSYLSTLQEELLMNQGSSETMNLSMYCFWTGEKEIGKLPGVFKTAAGFMNNREIVKVEFNPDLISEEELIRAANKARCADQVFTDNREIAKNATSILGSNKVQSASTFRLDKDQKYYLKNSKYHKIPMSEYQKMKVNSLLGSGKNPESILSPRQLQILSVSRIIPDDNMPFEKSWYEVTTSIK